MVIFGAHAFVNYANNLYTPKMLSLKITITHYFGNMQISPKIKHKQHNVHNRELSISSAKISNLHTFFVPKAYENGMLLHAANIESHF